ncbi:MAG: hypothetical protein ACOH2A_07520 [Sphingobacteriaceae bacterium]
MLKEDLISQISDTIGKKRMLEISSTLRDQGFDINVLIDISFHANQQIGFRASWILEHLILETPDLLLPYLNYLLQKFPEVSNSSCRRHYCKILMHLTSPKVKGSLSDEIGLINLEIVAETCFDWLINPEKAIAVKAFCCEILYNLKDRYPWIKEELSEQIHFLMKNGSPGIMAKGRKLLKK